MRICALSISVLGLPGLHLCLGGQKRVATGPELNTDSRRLAK
jgi:hypothetical protein